MKFTEYPDSEMMMIDLANQLAGELENCLLTHESATLAVPGGTTPGPVFDALCAADLDWSRVNVMLTDERWVPETSERSNTRLLKERLLQSRAAEANFIPFYSGHETPEEGLDEISGNLNDVLPISVLLLGMGDDMHTASLFPGADRLEDGLAKNAPPILPMRAAGAPEPRMTLTAPVLEAAMNIHVLIKGANKREALDNARGRSTLEAPINVILNEATVHWAES